MPPGNLAAMFGAGPPQMDSDQLNKILQPYGVQMPTTYQQPGPFENMPSFGSAHPAIAQGLDNALIAVSLMGPTGKTAGENISNVARGVLGVGPYRRAMLAQQAQMPLQMAGQVANLQHLGAENQELAGRGEYYRAIAANADWHKDASSERMNAALMRTQMEGTKQMKVTKRADGSEVVQQPFIDPHDPDFQVQWKDTDIDPADFKRTEAHGKTSSAFGGGLAGSVMATQLEAKYGDQLPALMSKPSPEFAQDVQKMYRQVQQDSAGFQGTQFREGTVPKTDSFREVTRANQAQLGKMQYGVKDRDKSIKEEQSRLLHANIASQNPPQDMYAAQAEANVKQRMDHDQKLQEMYTQYSMLPPEVQMTVPFSAYAQQQGYNPQTRFFQPQPQGGAQQAPQAMGGQQPTLSPTVQAVIDALKKPQ